MVRPLGQLGARCLFGVEEAYFNFLTGKTGGTFRGQVQFDSTTMHDPYHSSSNQSKINFMKLQSHGKSKKGRGEEEGKERRHQGQLSDEKGIERKNEKKRRECPPHKNYYSIITLCQVSSLRSNHLISRTHFPCLRDQGLLLN